MSFDPKAALNRIRGSNINIKSIPIIEPESPSFLKDIPSFNKSPVSQNQKITESILFANKFSEGTDSHRQQISKEIDLRSRIVELERNVQDLEVQLLQQKENLFNVKRQKSHLETQVIKLKYQKKQSNENYFQQPLQIDCNINKKSSSGKPTPTKTKNLQLQTLTRNLNQLTFIFTQHPQLSRPTIKITNRK